MFAGCQSWPDDFKPRTERDLHALLDELRHALELGTIVILDSSNDLTTIRRGGVWPDDIMWWKVECRKTGAVFELTADVYHGNCRWRRLQNG